MWPKTAIISFGFLLSVIPQGGLLRSSDDGLPIDRHYSQRGDELRARYEAGKDLMNRVYDSRSDTLRAWRDIETNRPWGSLRDRVSHNYYYQRLLVDLERSRVQRELNHWYESQRVQLQRQQESARLQCESRRSASLSLLLSELAVPEASRTKKPNAPSATAGSQGDIWEQLRRYTR